MDRNTFNEVIEFSFQEIRARMCGADDLLEIEDEDGSILLSYAECVAFRDWLNKALE